MEKNQRRESGYFEMLRRPRSLTASGALFVCTLETEAASFALSSIGIIHIIHIFKYCGTTQYTVCILTIFVFTVFQETDDLSPKSASTATEALAPSRDNERIACDNFIAAPFSSPFPHKSLAPDEICCSSTGGSLGSWFTAKTGMMHRRASLLVLHYITKTAFTTCQVLDSKWRAQAQYLVWRIWTSFCYPSLGMQKKKTEVLYSTCCTSHLCLYACTTHRNKHGLYKTLWMNYQAINHSNDNRSLVSEMNLTRVFLEFGECLSYWKP